MKENPALASEVLPELTPDQKAAHIFLSEVRTHDATQPLPYQYGIEASTLKSLRELYPIARGAMKDNPGCGKFAKTVTRLLDVHLRPLTYKWDWLFEEGRPISRDGADELRVDLHIFRRKLLRFEKIFHKMAYNEPYRDPETPPVLEPDDLKEFEFGALKFGIPSPGIPESGASEAKDTIGGNYELAKAFAGVNQAEAEAVKARRAYFNTAVKDGYNAAGLALSGGGLPSTAFGLGVAQVLAEKRLLQDIDFLSTVSGGGYTGSFLTGWLNSAAAVEEVGFPNGPDSAPIRYLRFNANYLAVKNPKDGWSMAISMLGGMLLNWTAPLCMIAFLTIAAIPMSKHQTCWAILFYFCAMSSLLALVVHGFCMRQDVDIARLSGAVLGWLAFFSVLAGVLWLLLDLGEVIIKHHLHHSLWDVSGISLTVGGAAAVIPSFIRILPILNYSKFISIFYKILVWGGILLIPLVALELFYTLWLIGDSVLDAKLGMKPVFGKYGYLFLWGFALFNGSIAFFVININLTGPHRLYRDGLAKTFLKNPGSPLEPGLVLLSEVNPAGVAPYHLLNAAVNLPSSQNEALRDRRCDFFLFSKHWMGATSVGYYPTGQWQANGQKVDLATAMTISGVRVAPRMDWGNKPAITVLQTLLNLRLNFWIKNPKLGLASFTSHPGFLCLLREMTGLGMSEEQAWLNLSDGGHIENMGVYELLRRRCKFVICVDGESDPDFTFSGLMTLVRHARIDFGVRIEPKLDEISQDPKTGLSKSHAHFCRIHYPALRDNGVEIAPAGMGLLLYLKLSVTGNEPELIKRYRIKHPEFPHQTTLDQFFDEEQFEVYRLLGVHVAEGLFSQGLMGVKAAPAGIREWFERLAVNLLLR